MNRDEVFKAIDVADVNTLEEVFSSDASLASSRSNDGISAVLFSLYINKPEITDLILLYNPNLDIYDLSALGETEKLSTLINANPKLVHEYNGVGFTALHVASYFGYQDTVALLIDNGAEVDKRTMDGSDLTALQSAVSNLKSDVVKVLLQFSADVNVQMLGGFTPLMTAAAMGSKELIMLLLENNANKKLTSDDGRDAVSFAVSAGHNEIANLVAY